MRTAASQPAIDAGRVRSGHPIAQAHIEELMSEMTQGFPQGSATNGTMP
jgi:hypothetical protein